MGRPRQGSLVRDSTATSNLGAATLLGVDYIHVYSHILYPVTRVLFLLIYHWPELGVDLGLDHGHQPLHVPG